MFNDLKNSLAVTIRFELRKIHPILYSSINKTIFICTWTKCFDRNLQPNYMWNVFSHAFQYCNFGLLNMSALKLLHSTVLNISKDRFNYRASRAPFLFISLEPEKLSSIRFFWCRHSFLHAANSSYNKKIIIQHRMSHIEMSESKWFWGVERSIILLIFLWRHV